MAVAEWMVLGVTAYAGVGVVFALWFVTRGVAGLDPAARGGPWGFRVLIFPGSAALWPVLWVMRARRRGGVGGGGDA
ncbi:MAG: hypothetical protein AAFX76_09540 [Planctomycetota bacterium]